MESREDAIDATMVSEPVQNRKRNQPRPRLMVTSRVDGVKAPRDAGTAPRSAHFFFNATFAAVRSARSECAKSPPQSAPWPCVKTRPPESCRNLSNVGFTAFSTACTLLRRDVKRFRSAAPLHKALAELPAYVWDCNAVRDDCAN